jgi:pre-mRNA-processing factor SLU7
VRNLRIREDTAKYLLNLDANSAHYDPKSRSMREDPNPNKVRAAAVMHTEPAAGP